MRRFAALCALVLSACGSGSLTGTWSATGVPFTFGSTAMTLYPTVTFDDKNNATIKLVAHEGDIVITATAQGTFTSTSTQLTITLPNTISAKSGDTTLTATKDADGAQCVTIAGAKLCFPSPQTNTYAIAADKLTMTVNYKVQDGAVSPLALQLTKSTK